MFQNCRGPLSRRWGLVEFCDKPWLSGELRGAFHDCLSFTKEVFGLYLEVPRVLAEWSSRVGNVPVLELCSGNGLNISYVIKRAKREGRELPKLVVSDLFPQVEDYKLLKSKHGEDSFDYIERPVSALAPFPEQFQAILICTALHHLDKDGVRLLIENTISSGKSLCVFEPFERSYKNLFLYIVCIPVNILVMMLACFFGTRFSLKRLLCTFVLPIAPLLVSIDGLISLLRMHKPEEVLAQIPQELSKQCEIRFGTMKARIFGESSYLWITPQTTKTKADS